MDFEVEQERFEDGATVEFQITIKRPDIEEQEELEVFSKPVCAQYYPGSKEEQWWVIIGRPKLNKIYAIKKISNFKAVSQLNMKMNFVAKRELPEDTKMIEFKVYLICDSYIGCDQEDTLRIDLI